MPVKATPKPEPEPTPAETIPVDEITRLRFSDNEGHSFRLEPRWYDQGTYDLTVIPSQKEAPHEPG